jgi:D-alanyl-D-alanine carboxypeptidase
MKQVRNPHHFLIFLLVVFALEAILFSVGNFKIEENIKKEENRTKKIEEILLDTPLLARAVSVYDTTEQKKVFGENDEVAMPIASLAKIMTVLVGLNIHSEDEIVVISENAINQNGDFGIFINEKWKVGDLAKFSLLVSANDGAYAVVEEDETFLEQMNSKAKRIGMTNVLFLNSTGLDIDTMHAGAVASALDVNIMASYALLAQPEIFGITTKPEINLKSESGFMHNFKNTNLIVDKIPNLLFSKTGYTELAGGNLVIIFGDRRGHKIAVTLLGSTFDGRFADMEKIVEVLYNN